MSGLATSWLTFAVLSAVFAALTTILAKIGVAGTSSNLATAIRTVVIIALAWALVLANGEVQGLSSITNRTWLFLVLSGLATGLSWICYFRALQLGPASLVAPVDKSSLAMVLVLSVAFLGEALMWQIVAGTTLIVLGTIVVIWP